MLPDEPVDEPDVPVEEPEPPDVPDCAATASGNDAARAVMKRVRMDEFISIGLRLREENDGPPLGRDTRGCIARQHSPVHEHRPWGRQPVGVSGTSRLEFCGRRRPKFARDGTAMLEYTTSAVRHARGTTPSPLRQRARHAPRNPSEKRWSPPFRPQSLALSSHQQKPQRVGCNLGLHLRLHRTKSRICRAASATRTAPDRPAARPAARCAHSAACDRARPAEQRADATVHPRRSAPRDKSPGSKD